MTPDLATGLLNDWFRLNPDFVFLKYRIVDRKREEGSSRNLAN